ncbi:MAG: ATP-binding protein [Clostridiales bacterium]|jgi:AAA15 family ATPase/GTPase|nr:ATP-binding protein [Clostridiales bacterium]
MLLQFNFKNYRSFKDDTTLDFAATKITEFGTHVISAANERVLPVAAIFGANGSGKTNALNAFWYMCNYVVNSFFFGGDENKKNDYFQYEEPTPFLFDNESKDGDTSFEVYFTSFENNSEKIYNYGFSLSKNGVTEEWLNCKSKSSRGEYKKIFYRNRKSNELDLSGIDTKMQENILLSLEKETLIVTLGAKLKVAKLKIIRDWFACNRFVNFGSAISSYILSTRIPNGFMDSPDVRKNVLKFFSSFDPSIVDFEVEIQNNDNANESRKVYIYALHKMTDSNKLARIPFEAESSGTLKMFSLYQRLQNALESGGVFVIDELNANLHPLLVRVVILTFLNPEINKNHAQLIFTTHDAWQLNNNILRRDEIWFAEKSEEGVSTLYSLADFEDEDGTKIRKDENYEKNYLLGKYGAIPSLKHLFALSGE